jgi:ribosomal-protein-alanine N-acetyltransferase
VKKRPRTPAAKLRRGRLSDLDALLAFESDFFGPDHRISRRSFRAFIVSPNCALIVAEIGRQVAGCALVLFRRGSTLARLYTIAVAAEFQRRGHAGRLLAAAEDSAKRRGCRAMRLEVRANDAGAIALYETSGYRLFGRRSRYYDGRVDALRFEKPLAGKFRRHPA